MLIHSKRIYLSLMKDEIEFIDSIRGSVPRSEFIKNIIHDYLYGPLSLGNNLND